MKLRGLVLPMVIFALLLAGLPAGASPAGAGPESLSGSFVAFHPAAGGDACFTPGTAQTFCFTAETYTDDWEYAYDLWVRFPADWSVSDVYVQGTPVCEIGGFADPDDFSWAFVTAPHEVQITHTREMDTVDHCVAVYCFEVTSGSGAPYAQESWYWSGDGWGDPPYNPCSSDTYTPAGQPLCDESALPPAAVPPCTWPPGLYIEPGQMLLEGCNGVPQPASFSVTNRTGAAGTFDVTYSVLTGNGALTGPATITIGDGETASLDVELTPDLCTGAGDLVEGLLQVSSNDYAAEAGLQETVAMGSWANRAPAPVSDFAWAAVSATDPDDGLEYLYVFGSVRQRIYRYDPRLDTWETLALLPGRLYEASDGVAFAGHLYARTDGQGTVTQSLFDYDIAADSWSAEVVPAQHFDRSYYEAVELDGWLYFIGGTLLPDDVTTNQVDRYDPATGTWEAVAPMLHNRASASSWAYDGRIYVAGGYDDNGDLQTTEVYDPSTNTWAVDPAFPALPATWFGAADAVLHGDRLWMMGGYYSFSESNRTAYWSASEGAWHMGPRLAHVVVDTEADLLAGHLHVVGGAFLGVTDHNQQMVECPSCLSWDKLVNGQPWQAGVPVVVQTHDLVTVTETVLGHNFALSEGWDPARLELVDYQAGDGVVVADADSLQWQVPYGAPAPHTLTQTFRVLPCTWTETIIAESLWSEGVQVGSKPLLIEKTPPSLSLGATYNPGVQPGEEAAFTLTYGNSGGLENDAMVRVDFPEDAPFHGALPAPDRVDPAGLWAEWDLGNLAQGAQGSIDVTALVAVDAPAGPLQATAGLYDHTGSLAATAAVQWQVSQPAGYFLYLPLVVRNK